jgi:hypothetical protein
MFARNTEYRKLTVSNSSQQILLGNLRSVQLVKTSSTFYRTQQTYDHVHKKLPLVSISSWQQMLLVLRLYSISEKMINESEAAGRMRIGKGKWNTLRKPALVPHRSPQIPHGLTWDEHWVILLGSWQLNVWTMAWPYTFLQLVVTTQGSCFLLVCY